MTVYRVQSTLGSENEPQAWNSGQSPWRKTDNLTSGVCKEQAVRVKLETLFFFFLERRNGSGDTCKAEAGAQL